MTRKRSFWGWIKGLFGKSDQETVRSGLSTPGGLTEVCSVGGSDPKDAPQAAHGEIRLVNQSAGSRQWPCGHGGPSGYDYDIFGDIIKTDKSRLADSDKCGQCVVEEMSKVIIPCCLCGLAILPGSAVALYGNSRRMRSNRTVINGNAVGCLRWDCCPSGAFFAGHWTGKTVKSAFGNGRTAAEEAMATGETIIGNTNLPDGDSGK